MLQKYVKKNGWVCLTKTRCFQTFRSARRRISSEIIPLTSLSFFIISRLSPRRLQRFKGSQERQNIAAIDVRSLLVRRIFWSSRSRRLWDASLQKIWLFFARLSGVNRISKKRRIQPSLLLRFTTVPCSSRTNDIIHSSKSEKNILQPFRSVSEKEIVKLSGILHEKFRKSKAAFCFDNSWRVTSRKRNRSETQRKYRQQKTELHTSGDIHVFNVTLRVHATNDVLIGNVLSINSTSPTDPHSENRTALLLPGP